MFVGFLGAPNSGKTTIAAQVFAELKKNGQPNVEFIAEEARRYIAEKKHEDGTIELTDRDQQTIFERQADAEIIMHAAAGNGGIIVSDSCALNSLWYMTDYNKFLDIHRQSGYLDFLQRDALLFYCPIVGIHTNDNLRIHNQKQAQAIDAICGGFIILNQKWLPIKAQLSGPIDYRTNKVIEKIYERLMQ